MGKVLRAKTRTSKTHRVHTFKRHTETMIVAGASVTNMKRNDHYDGMLCADR